MMVSRRFTTEPSLAPGADPVHGGDGTAPPTEGFDDNTICDEGTAGTGRGFGKAAATYAGLG